MNGERKNAYFSRKNCIFVLIYFTKSGGMKLKKIRNKESM